MSFCFQVFSAMSPGTFSNVPGNGAWELFLMCPGWRYSKRNVVGLLVRQKVDARGHKLLT